MSKEEMDPKSMIVGAGAMLVLSTIVNLSIIPIGTTWAKCAIAHIVWSIMLQIFWFTQEKNQHPQTVNMKSEQQKLNDHLDFLKDILSERVIDALRVQVGRAMSECITKECEKGIDARLLTLEPMLKYYEHWADHNPVGVSALNDVVKKIKELYPQIK